MDMKAQGALEYLIIIAAVLAIAAIVVVVLSGAFGGTQKSTTVSNIQMDASACAEILSAEGKEIGEYNVSLCHSTCEEWNQSTIDAAQLTSNGQGFVDDMDTPAWMDDISDVYTACISGKPDWIRESA